MIYCEFVNCCCCYCVVPRFSDEVDPDKPSQSGYAEVGVFTGTGLPSDGSKKMGACIAHAFLIGNSFAIINW